MNRTGWTAFAGIAILGTLGAGCGDSNADTSARAARPVQAVTVKVREITPRPFTETLKLSGTIKAYDDITISAEEGGTIKEWKVEKGRRVSKGTVLALINDDIVKPGFDAALAQYKSSQLTFEKQQKVYGEEAISEWQLKTAEYNRDAAAAQSDLMKSRWDHTRITSPVGGILDERYVDTGEMAGPGMPVARVVNISEVKVRTEVPERYAGTIHPGTEIDLTVLAYPGETFSGTISYVGSTINADNRTFPVEARVANGKLRLKPEMIAKVEIAQANRNDALLLDEGIVQQIDRNRLVVYVEKDHRAVERAVTLGSREGNLVEIVSGLQPGDRVITSGYQNIINGQQIAIEE
jgi:membrane fusion protein, multidrug efflux system